MTSVGKVGMGLSVCVGGWLSCSGGEAAVCFCVRIAAGSVAHDGVPVAYGALVNAWLGGRHRDSSRVSPLVHRGRNSVPYVSRMHGCLVHGLGI